MNKESILKEKAFSFGLMVMTIIRSLKQKTKQSQLSNQLLRSGTAVGALIREAEFAQSKADFVNKMYIALKEANESDYWLNLFYQSGIIDTDSFQSANKLVAEIIAMLVATIRTAKRNGLLER
jgi:four helix bundle protein